MITNAKCKMQNAKWEEEKVHEPVLLKEVIEYLNVRENRNYIDCTIGEGGHAREILRKNGPRGKILGIEIDPELYQKLKKEKLERLILVNYSYSNLKEIVKRENFGKVSGILFDLGISSWHLEKSKRGFSFLKDEPLIMRYDLKNEKITASEILNKWPREDIERIIKEFGQEKFAKNITREILKERKFKKIERTSQLVEIIKRAVPIWYQKRKIHFATKTFQALRIAVNNELENLKKGLKEALEILEPGGRMVVISFHSLEDRIVKNFFKENSKKGILKILTKKPIRPKIEEIKINPRSRSAKLRAGQKI
jgi:16S rRNA (cytosine1402-N4)-methyltransferase